MINISAGGVFLALNAYLMPGKEVSLSFDAPSGKAIGKVLPETATGRTIKAVGEVVRAELKPGYGLRICAAIHFHEGFRISNPSETDGN